MDSIIGKIGWVITSIAALIGAMLSIVIKVKNPDMTEMRIFLNNWQFFCIIGIVAIGGAILIRIGNDKRNK